MKGRMDVMERIERLMKEQGIYHKDLITFLGLPEGTFHNWNRGKGYSYMLYLERIAEYLNVSTEYLLTGRVSDKVECELPGARPDEAEILKAYNALTIIERRKALRVLKALADT